MFCSPNTVLSDVAALVITVNGYFTFHSVEDKSTAKEAYMLKDARFWKCVAGVLSPSLPSAEHASSDL